MFIGIDIGTSAVKLSLVTEDLTQISEATAPLTVQSMNPYWSEQDPSAWWDALIAAFADLRQRHDLTGVQALGLSGQMHGAVLLDAERRIIRPAILWNDGRAHLECEAMAKALPSIADLAGVPPMPGFTAPKLLWLKHNEPDAFARIAHVLLPKDFIGYRLHGGLVTDRSDAAGTHWLDQKARRWSPDLCAVSSTDPSWLPTLMDGPDIAGVLTSDVAALFGLRPEIPVAAGGGDAATGAAGIGAIGDGDAFLSLGTSGQLFVATDSYRRNPDQMVHAYCHTVPNMWFQMAAMLNGARPLQWFADISGARVATLLAEAKQIAPHDAPLFLPYLTGERSPHGDAHIRGSFYGLTDSMTRAHLMRGIVNAVAFSFADAADSLRAAGTEIADPLAIGGGAQSDLLLQTIADVIRISVRRAKGSVTGPALGAARLAAVASGAADLADISRRPESETWFEPSPSADYEAALKGYRGLYRRLKGIHLDNA
ncbi:MAG: xylulokinase [Pseudomonadota bacterium]